MISAFILVSKHPRFCLVEEFDEKVSFFFLEETNLVTRFHLCPKLKITLLHLYRVQVYQQGSDQDMIFLLILVK